MRITFRKFSVAVGALALLFPFQNCSRAPLIPIPEDLPSVSGFNDIPPICSQTEVDDSASKFIFIVDMSGSNLGDWKLVGAENFWDSTKATDPEGKRLKLIRNFLIDGICGSDPMCPMPAHNETTPAGNDFAVIGFSWDNLAVTRSNSTTGFVSAPNALTQIDRLLDKQNGVFDALGTLMTPGAAQLYQCFETQSYQNPLSTSVSCPARGYSLKTCGAFSECDAQMHETSYMKALQLAQEFITTDSTATPTKNYYVFMLSDGLPTDDLNTNAPDYAGRCDQATAEDRLDCQRDKIFALLRGLRLNLQGLSRNMFLYGLYYTYPGGPTTGAEFLDEMVSEAKTGKMLTLESITAELGKGFFKSIIQNATIYEPFNIQAVPLTTILRGEEVLADSDMDGVADIDETSPANARNPRSNPEGTLDGIYNLLVEKGLLNSLTCSAAERALKPSNYTGLTDCDVKALHIGSAITALTPGLDSDGDGVIDLVEVLKHMNPRVSEMSQDTDHDSVLNLKEILQGSDPFVPDAGLQSFYLNSFTVKSAPPAQVCLPTDKKAYTLKLDHLQNASTQAVSTNLPSYLQHGENEGIIYVGYRLVATSAPTTGSLPARYFARFVRVKYLPNGGFEEIGPVEDFIEIGER
ncbi:MAG: hypothetical protein AB7G93_20940 [Bdellovibrionales bacterium]